MPELLSQMVSGNDGFLKIGELSIPIAEWTLQRSKKYIDVPLSGSHGNPQRFFIGKDWILNFKTVYLTNYDTFTAMKLETATPISIEAVQSNGVSYVGDGVSTDLVITSNAQNKDVVRFEGQIIQRKQLDAAGSAMSRSVAVIPANFN